MASIEYSLFRVKFIKPVQESLPFTDSQELTAGDILLEVIRQKPSAELRKGFRWHIGNLVYFNSFSGYFAVGRTTSATVAKFDNNSGNFTEEELEESPYTHCVFDAKIGLFGIAKRTSLSASSVAISTNLEKLLATADIVKDHHLTVEVRPIPDPIGFIKALKDAFRVFRFSATFRGPNPFDADKFFQKPLSVYLNSAKGERGKTTISGEDLERDVLIEVTRSTAATGNEASARLVKQYNQKPITVNLEGDPVKRKYDEEVHSPRFVLSDLLELYNRIRHEKD